MAEAGMQERRRDDPREPRERARVDAVAGQALAVDLVDDLDDPHHADQQADHGGALEAVRPGGRSSQCPV